LGGVGPEVRFRADGRGKLTKKIGTLPADVLYAVEEGVKAALDLE
jgi:hypothetical protein